MTTETSRKILNVFGIIDIILGTIGIIVGVFAAAGGGALSGAAGFVVLVLGVVLIFSALFSLLEGIFARRAAKDPSRVMPAFVFAIISLVFALLGLYNAVSGSGSFWTAGLNVLVNGLLFAAANTLRKAT